MNKIKRLVVFGNTPYWEYADLDEWMKLIYRNFEKCVKILIAIYGRVCPICDKHSPLFRTDSGTAEHLWSRHRKATALFMLNVVMKKNPEEIERLMNNEN